MSYCRGWPQDWASKTPSGENLCSLDWSWPSPLGSWQVGTTTTTWALPSESLTTLSPLFVMNVLQAIVDEYGDEVVSIPTTPDGWHQLSEKVVSRWKFLHACRALDGKHYRLSRARHIVENAFWNPCQSIPVPPDHTSTFPRECLNPGDGLHVSAQPDVDQISRTTEYCIGSWGRWSPSHSWGLERWRCPSRCLKHHGTHSCNKASQKAESVLKALLQQYWSSTMAERYDLI